MEKLTITKCSLSEFATPYYDNPQIGGILQRLILNNEEEAYQPELLKSVLEDEFYKLTYFVYFEDSLDTIQDLIAEDWAYMQQEEANAQRVAELYQSGEVCYIDELETYCFLLFIDQ